MRGTVVERIHGVFEDVRVPRLYIYGRSGRRYNSEPLSRFRPLVLNTSTQAIFKHRGRYAEGV